MDYEPVIGFEIHVELRTKSKMFCGCKNDPFGAGKPNIYTCPVCLGLPGALPVANKKAVDWAILVGFALGCEISKFSKFDRKHYFYPDLPKGYQISQYDQPLCVNGKVAVEGGDVRIQRVHLEEDTGKLLHTTVAGKKVTLVDFNRSGVPLVEIVTMPDVKSGEHAKAFLKKIHQVIRYLGVSDADMEKGSMRLEPNISLRKKGESSLPSYKVEVKNINSFNFVKRAIEYEIARQSTLLAQGEQPLQENRGWNEEKGVTVPQRTKEEAEDYRYFPDPDIPPLRIGTSHTQHLTSEIGELADAKKERFMRTYALQEKEASLVTETRELADYFEEAVRVAKEKTTLSPSQIANWLINKKPNIDEVLPAQLVASLAEAKAVVSLSPDELMRVILEVVRQQSKAADDYKKGKQQALMFLMGQVKRKLPKGDTQKILGALKEALEKK